MTKLQLAVGKPHLAREIRILTSLVWIWSVARQVKEIKITEYQLNSRMTSTIF
jgi:hypothetical protein